MAKFYCASEPLALHLNLVSLKASKLKLSKENIGLCFETYGIWADKLKY